MVEIGGVYRHYKGGEYEVLLTAKMESDGSQAVVYEDTKNPDKVWIRPLSEWEEYVLYEDIEIPRFSLIEQEDDGETV